MNSERALRGSLLWGDGRGGVGGDKKGVGRAEREGGSVESGGERGDANTTAEGGEGGGEEEEGGQEGEEGEKGERGSFVEDFVNLGSIGRGGYGVVYKARKRHGCGAGRLFAVKVVRVGREGRASTARRLERAQRREVGAMGRMGSTLEHYIKEVYVLTALFPEHTLITTLL
jgi:hypothetical protein